MNLVRALVRRGKGHAYLCETPGFGLRTKSISPAGYNQNVLTFMPSSYGRACRSKSFQVDMDYLKVKGYGNSSYKEIRERQRDLGLLGSSNKEDGCRQQQQHANTPYPEEEFGAFQIDIDYLKAKGFGSSSYEEIRERQRRLGLLDNHRVDGGDHSEQLISVLQTEYGRLAIGELSGAKLIDAASKSKTNQQKWIDASNNSFVRWLSKKSARLVQPRPRWILDGNFIINLLQDPQNENEEKATDASTKVFEKIQAERAQVLLPEVCLAEAAHMLRKRGLDHLILSQILKGVLEGVSMKESGDWKRVKELHDIYSSHHRMSMVDCCLVSIAEGLDIINLATFDRRHMLLVFYDTSFYHSFCSSHWCLSRHHKKGFFYV